LSLVLRRNLIDLLMESSFTIHPCGSSYKE
jgi:hypothetical protein